MGQVCFFVAGLVVIALCCFVLYCMPPCVARIVVKVLPALVLALMGRKGKTKTA